MDVFEIRKENLSYLIRKEFGTVAKFSRASGIDDSYLRRLLFSADKKGSKRIGDETVRKVLEVANKPPGWMDVPQWKAADSNVSVTLPIENHRLGRILAAFNNNKQGECDVSPSLVTMIFHVESHNIIMGLEKLLNLHKTENKVAAIKEAINFLELAVEEYSMETVGNINTEVEQST